MGMSYASWNMLYWYASCANLHAKQQCHFLYLAIFLLGLTFSLNLFCDFEVLIIG